MTDAARPLGSLSSGLLARKGEARPAMRSQAIGGAGTGGGTADDLGWNDMGSPAVRVGDPVPHVLVERAALDAAIAAPAAVRTVSVPTAMRLDREAAEQGRAAFTLRVDPVRHLKLRIACAIADRSAQDLVTLALDALLDSIPEVDALVAQLPRQSSAR